MNKKKMLSILTAILLMNSKALSSSSGYSKKYQNGIVYIGSQEYLDNITNVCDNDIFILDVRDEKDPNMKVLSSYLINDLKVQREILKIMLEYEEKNPSLWDRSMESMQNEWLLHNLMAIFSYKKERTMDVDFNNGDEEKYKILRLK